VTASGRIKPHERVTIGHVAQRAGVSAGTVSNYLNRPHTVAPGTRTRIQAAIDELRFVRNANASQLRSGRFRAIGLVVLDVANPFFTEVARGVEDAAREADYVTILCNSDESTEREQRYLEVLEERQVECILISPVGDDQRQLRSLRDRGRRVVLVDRTSPSADQCAVAVDDVRGGELAVAHLLESGHSRIACVSGPLSIRQCADRLAGARRAVDAAGGDPDVVLEVIELPSLSVAAGREAAGHLLGRDDAPTAAFCANDLLALGLLAGAQADGRRVPDELAIIGYDDIEFAANAATPLSSIRQPKYELGHAAARLALDEARDPGGHAHQQIIFQPELVVRESTEGSGA
jgi:LacI family transcriptional regulator, galactose operon repressor